MTSEGVSEELDELAFLNFGESLREFVRWGENGVLYETADTLRTRTDVAFSAGSFNTAVHVGTRSFSALEWLREQRAWFREQGRGFSVHAREGRHAAIERVCLDAGFELGAKPAVMLRRSPFAARLPAPGIAVRLATTDADWQAFIDITVTSYVSMGFPADITRRLMSFPDRMRRPVWRAAIVSHEGIDRGAAVLLFSHSIAGVYWVGTLPDARKQGLATTLVHWLTNFAFDQGARAVVLQASEAGAPVYHRLGFVEFTRYPMYVLARPEV
ncbi:MAG: GNAT family N-acetyltransferase [Myxococcota bacterium]